MGEELQMAREEEEGQPMLLVRAGNGEVITTASNRNKRPKTPGTYRRYKGRKIKDTETESEDGSEVEGTSVSSIRAARRRRSDTDREQGRADEGENGRFRRSAQGLGITYPGSYCDDAELIPHYWYEVDKSYGGSLMQCRFCRRHLWLPLAFTEAVVMMKYTHKYGMVEGYCRYLNRHRPAKMLMAKMQDLRKLEVEVSNKREFARLADKILSDKEYDRIKEATNG